MRSLPLNPSQVFDLEDMVFGPAGTAFSWLEGVARILNGLQEVGFFKEIKKLDTLRTPMLIKS
jgi:hypothetical protein